MSLVPSIADVPRETWATVSYSASYHYSWNWLRCAQEVSGAPTSVVLLRTGARVVAAMPFWLTTGRENARLDPVTALAGVGLAPGRYIVAGAARGYSGQLLLADDLADETLAEQVVPPVVAGLRAAAAQAGARGCLVLYARGGQLPLYRHVLPGRVAVLLDLDATITVGGPGDPLWTGLSRHRRSRLRMEQSRFMAAGFDLSRERLGECADEFAPLAANLERRHGSGVELAALTAQLHTQVKWCDEDSVVFAARRDGRMAAACLCYVSRRGIVCRMYGFDEALAGSAYEYFNLGYYLPTRYAAEHGLRTVELGMTAMQAKRLRGAVPSPLWAVDLSPEPSWSAETARRANRRRARDLACSDDPDVEAQSRVENG